MMTTTQCSIQTCDSCLYYWACVFCLYVKWRWAASYLCCCCSWSSWLFVSTSRWTVGEKKQKHKRRRALTLVGANTWYKEVIISLCGVNAHHILLFLTATEAADPATYLPITISTAEGFKDYISVKMTCGVHTVVEGLMLLPDNNKIICSNLCDNR